MKPGRNSIKFLPRGTLMLIVSSCGISAGSLEAYCDGSRLDMQVLAAAVAEEGTDRIVRGTGKVVRNYLAVCN